MVEKIIKLVLYKNLKSGGFGSGLFGVFWDVCLFSMGFFLIKLF